MKSPRITCDLGYTADFGYGDREHYACTSPATHRARTIFADYSYSTRKVIPIVQKVLLCETHAKEWVATEEAQVPYTISATPAYRFRRI